MIYRAVITFCVLIALTLSSFGHRILSPQDQAQAQAYVLAGGDWADLCADGGAPLTAATTCMACILAQGCALPTVAVSTETVAIVASVVWPTEADGFPTSQQTAPYPARAPPFV